MSSVEQLIARFRLRRRADSRTYARGVALADRGAVDLVAITSTAVSANVGDGVVRRVELQSHGTEIDGSCPCVAGRGEVCAHQVAAAHAVWLRSRRELTG